MVEVAIKVTQAAPGTPLAVLALEVEVEVLALPGMQVTPIALAPGVPAAAVDNSCNMHHMASKQPLAMAQHPMEDGLGAVVAQAVDPKLLAASGVVVVAMSLDQCLRMRVRLIQVVVVVVATEPTRTIRVLPYPRLVAGEKADLGLCS
jgi:hypothetical protein